MTTTKKAPARRPATKTPPKPAAPSKTLTATVRGVDVEVAAEAINDWELAEAVGAVQAGDVAGQMLLPTVMRRLIGAEAYNALKDQFRDADTGRVDAEGMGEALGELLVALNPN